MKQNITIDQLNELSEEGQRRLKEWWDNKYTTAIEDMTTTKYTDATTAFFGMPVISIGQMIEFLDEQGKEDVEYGFDPAEVYNYKGGYVLIQWFDAKDHDLELADVLWKACKEILQKEHNGIH